MSVLDAPPANWPPEALELWQTLRLAPSARDFVLAKTAGKGADWMRAFVAGIERRQTERLALRLKVPMAGVFGA